MAESTVKLHYRKEGITTDISLYDVADSNYGTDYLRIRHNSNVLFACLCPPTDYKATDLRVRKGNTIYAVQSSGIARTTGEIKAVNFSKYLVGADYSGDIFTVNFEVPHEQVITFSSRIEGTTAQGAKSDWWCWTHIKTVLDNTDLSDLTLLRSDGNGETPINRVLFSGSQTVAGGSHALKLAVNMHASKGDGNSLKINNWEIHIDL